MALSDNYDLELLKNESEIFVFDEIERQLAEITGDQCRCNDCILDIATIALNTVKPMYRFSILGSLYASSSDDDYAESVKKAVATAISKVHKNPSHD